MKTPLEALLLLAMIGCSVSDDSDDSDSTSTISTWTTSWGADQSTSFAFLGNSFAYLASEQLSDDFDANKDGDWIDKFPVVVNTSTRVETQLGVAAQDMVWVDDHLYIDVLESKDDNDWDGVGGLGGRVLLHWTSGMTSPEYVVTLDPSGDLAVISTGSLAVAATADPITASDTSLVVFEAANPTTAVVVPNDDVPVGATLELLAEEDGLVFVGIDETSSALDHNGDGDANDDGDVGDERVLALLDATYEVSGGAYPDPLYSIGLALPGGDTPLLAEVAGAHNWLVAFLVDEADQDDGSITSLNHPDELGFSITPSHCAAVKDTDIDDEVLHFMDFSDEVLGGFDVSNSGLVGGERIIHVDGYIGTVSREGDESSCDLNNDGDLDDRIFRWVKAESGTPPENNDSRLHALGDIGGPAGEIAEMGDRFVIVVNEVADGRDLDGSGEEGGDRDLVAWLRPSAVNAWEFHHDDEDHPDTGWMVATWLGEVVGNSYVGVGISERSNLSFDLNGDDDSVDSFPTRAYYSQDAKRMKFWVPIVAGVPDEMGVTMLGNRLYYRVSEADNGGDDLDSNGDGSGYLLCANRLSDGQMILVSYLNDLVGPSIWSDPVNASCAAFLVDEREVGDINGDSDEDGFAVRYLRF